MIKRVCSLLLLVSVAAFATEHLIRINLDDARLAPLAEYSIHVLTEMEHCAIVLLDDIEVDKIASLDYQILASDPAEGDFYLARPMTDEADLSLYSDILTRDGADYLIRVHPGMLTQVLNQKVMVKRISFTPMVIKSSYQFPDVDYSQTVADIVDLVDPDSVLEKVQRLQDFRTRLSEHDSCMAAANEIFDRFTALGMDTVYFQYHTGGHAPNVIAVKNGTVYPDSIYAIICGHFDSFAFYSPDEAPGADDNASGTAAVIEAARVMRTYDFEYSVRYIAFSGEEYGMYGSGYYAQQARSQGDSIIGVINGDMLAYVDATPESLEVIAKPTNPPCEPFADFFIACADTYTTLMTNKVMSYTMIYSDHSPFWDQGYVALCNIEDWGNYGTNNPFVHTPGDSIGAGFNDLGFSVECTRAEIAALALLAVPDETSIDELTQDWANSKGFSVRPSIGRALFTILFAGSFATPEHVVIHDATGRTVKNISLPAPEGIGHVSVVWAGTDNAGQTVPAGVYFVVAGTVDQTKTAKLVLVR